MIIIIGDSWGVGEWDRECCLSGPGFGQLMMLHTSDGIVNLSAGNFSNTQAINRLELFFNRFSPNDTDTIYWVVTCPTRCVTEKYYIDMPGGIVDNSYEILHKSLDRANQLAQQHNIKINLIGGLCDLDSVDVQQYSNLEMRVASWGRLLDANYHTYPIMPAYLDTLGTLLKQQRPDLLDEWIEIVEQTQSKITCWKKMQYFSADGSHPDRNGHLVLRNHLYPEFSSIR